MERIKVLAITLLTAFLMFMPQVIGIPQQPSNRPLCVSQLTLANYACGRLPLWSSGPETPSSNLVFPDDHRHGHRHRRRSEGKDHDHDTPVDDCCRWLNDLDDECICELLVRLPPFLARPLHQYTVVIADACNVTYTCSGRVRP
ncbi:uncharacterized protein LOC8266772 [Ricinus communis]|uniref:Bifunctional inhibitor/plant lipid transfer protein/seed storage helical domain-containing protein n=1 Tax=Ricinus communis TaxID=3988 RepID=B9T498_RICCO|nr:uncharacterized protein LOC8266772 [Ricinus communis]EEF29306.1 conserved hypothetical protein [Ricinus communis]|eukprot:XP_002533067.1 uncharacterized protein LOC8266772 [Ricinus communis]